MSIWSKAQEYKDSNTFNCSIGEYGLLRGKVTKAFKKWPASECDAEIIEDGSDGERATGGRIVAGALLGGSTGAIAGALARKSNTSGWLIITTPDGEKHVKLKGNLMMKARTFVMNLELEKRRQAAL